MTVLVNFNDISESSVFNSDVCIVGAGAAGITLALELIPTGKNILLLEGGDIDFSSESQSLYKMDLESPRFEPPDISRLRLFGGSTNHWAGSVRTLDPIDFESRSWVSHSGWPFTYSDLLPYYHRAFPYIEAGPLYTDEESFTPHLDNLKPKIDSSGFVCRLGYSSPPTRFGQRYRGALLSAPNLTIMLNANLCTINEAPDRRSVRNLTITNYRNTKSTISARYYVLALGGIENARALLLSDAVTPGGLGNEHGRVGRHFMDHPTVKALVFYPSGEFISAWQEGRVKIGAQMHSLSLQAKESTLREHALVNARMPLIRSTKLQTSEGIEAAHQIEKGLSEGLGLPHILSHLWNVMKDGNLLLEQWRRRRGAVLLESEGSEYGGYVLDMMMEQRPDPENRIELTREVDALGLRKGKVFYRIPQNEKDDFKRLTEIFAKGVGSQGLGFVHSFLDEDDTDRRFDEIMGFGSHHMGTTRASVNPRIGVVDQNQKIHGRENIFVAGSSVFPTGGHVPPTTTIVATSIRLADHLRMRLV